MIRIKETLFFILIALPLIAQNNSSSPYSSTGLGENTFNGTQATRHMGGLDVFTDSIHANLANPASYGFLKFTTYSIGVNYINNYISDISESQNTDIASLDYLSVSIPTKKFGFGFGIIPFTSIGYRLQDVSELEDSNIFNRYEGSGGLNRAYFSLGIPISKNISIGSSLNYNFGNLLYRSGQFVDGIDNGTFLVNESDVSGFNYQLSLQLVVPINKKFKAQAMFSLEPLSFLDSQNRRIFYTQSLSRETIIEFTEIDLAQSNLNRTTLELSPVTKIGFGLGKNKKWFFGAQYNLTKTSTFDNSFFERNNVSYQDSKKWSLGGYFIPNYASFTSFWSRVVYRFGFRSEQMSTIINNVPIIENGITFGLGLPLTGLSNVNVGLEIIQRGQSISGLVQERILALRVGLSLNDIWFIKRVYN